MRIILLLTVVLLAGSARTQAPDGSATVADVDEATLMQRLSGTAPGALQSAIDGWQFSRAPWVTYRRQCFEALAAAQKSGAIGDALSVCEPAARNAKLTPRKFVSSILDAMK